MNEALADGESIRIRALRPDDKDRLASLFGQLSPRSVYQRFLGARGDLKETDLEYLTNLDFYRQVALAATLSRDGEEVLVAVARYMTAPGDRIGRPELGIVVEDAHQHRGIGTLLLRHLLEVASAQGIDEFEAHILAENTPMVAFLDHLGTDVKRVISEGVTSVAFRTNDALERIPGR